MHIALKFLYHQMLAALNKKSYRHPLSVYIYLTFRCNLRCAYCDGGAGVKFPEVNIPELTVDEWLRILKTLRSHSDALFISGGEPTVYKELLTLIEKARHLGYNFISLNTNGLLLTPDLIDSIDYLILSLDSTNPDYTNQLWGKKGAAEKVIHLMETLSGRKRPKIVVNSVILPDNIADVSEVLDFCIQRDLTFSAGPALIQTRPVAGLAANPEYIRLLDRILSAKKKGHKIYGSYDYYHRLKTFEPFDCHPLLVWRVYPDGQLVFPCSRRNQTIGSLLETPDPLALFKQAAGGEFFETNCSENCPMSCYMDITYLIQNPGILIREGYLQAKSGLNSLFRKIKKA